MQILVVGAGVVGCNLARILSREGHDICLVDRDAMTLKRVKETMDVKTVLGAGTSPKILREAGIENTEMLVAVTDSDEVNLVICMIGQALDIPRKVARIRNEEYTAADALIHSKRLGVDLPVNPERELVAALMKLIETPGACDVAEFAGGEILLRGFHVREDVSICGKRLADLREVSLMDSFLIAAIVRGEKLIIPKGDDVIMVNDTVYVLVSEATLPLLLPFFNKNIEDVQNIVIYSAENATIRFARELEEKDVRVTLIEPDKQRAEEASKILSKTRVLHGEATELDTLREADVENANIFFALADDDRTNLLAVLMARKHGAHRTVIRTHDPDYGPLLAGVGVDAVVNPRLITVSAISHLVRRGRSRIRSVVKLQETEAEALELEAFPHSPVANKKLRDAKFPSGALVGAIIRDGMMLIPDGETRILPGERVIVISHPRAIHKLEKLFARKD